MRLSRLLERERAGDVHLEWTSLDQSVELVDDLPIGFAVVGRDLRSRSGFGFGLYAVGIGDAPAAEISCGSANNWTLPANVRMSM